MSTSGRIQLAAVCSATVDVPTACGQVQMNFDGTTPLPGKITQGYSGFARNLGFIDERQKNPGGSPEGEDPSLEYVHWQTFQTYMAGAVNGMAPLVNTLAWDADLDTWSIRADIADGVTITNGADDLGRKWFYLTMVDDTLGQNLGAIGGIVDSATSGIGTPTYTQRQRARFISPSDHNLNAGQGWVYHELRYGHNGLEILSLADAVEGPAPGTDMQPLNLNTAGFNGILNDPIAHALTAIYWGIGGSTGLLWGLVLPANRNGVGGLLIKSTDFGAHWNIMDRNYHIPGAIGSQTPGQPETKIDLRVENGTAVFTTPTGDSWRFRDPDDPVNGFVSPAGKVGVYWSGGAGIWNLSPRAPATGGAGVVVAGATAGKPGGFVLPATFNNDPADATALLIPPNPSTSTCKVTAHILNGVQMNAAGFTGPEWPNDANHYWIQCNLIADANGAGPLQIPVVLGVQEVRRAKIQTFSNPQGDLAEDLLSVSWRLNKRYRGNTMTLKVKNETGQWNKLSGNELVKLTVAVVTGDAVNGGDVVTGVPVTVCGGFIKKPRRRRGQEFPGTPGIIEIETQDWEFRLKKKKMTDMPAFGGWDLRDAIDHIFNRKGIAPAWYDLTNIPAGAYIMDGADSNPGGRGRLTYDFKDSVTVIAALDKMLADKGLAWGNGPDMIIRFWQVGDYDTTATYILNDTTFDPGVDLISYVESDSDLDSFYNLQTVHSRTKGGDTRTVRLINYQSIYGVYGTTPGYVGDAWENTSSTSAGVNPEPLAQVSLANAGVNKTTIVWETDLNFAVIPRQLVTIDIANDAVATGTEMELREQSGRIEYGQTFTGRITNTLGGKITALGGF